MFLLGNFVIAFQGEKLRIVIQGWSALSCCDGEVEGSREARTFRTLASKARDILIEFLGWAEHQTAPMTV